MFSRLIAALTRSFGSLLTPIKANGLSLRLVTSDLSCGYMARQGGHQSPQKPSITHLALEPQRTLTNSAAHRRPTAKTRKTGGTQPR
jgi:hypothetical protein